MDKFLLDNLMAESWNYPSLIQSVRLPEITAANIHLDVLRLDTLHPIVSGNKWFKLKGHWQAAFGPPPATSPQPPSSILTFGGAWSNHLIATAYAAQQAGIPSIGIIRGERPPVLSATLDAAAACGMQLEFISRKQYLQKDSQAFLREWEDRFPGIYIIPEGGAGIAGINGSKDILHTNDTTRYSHILCAVGTGTMFLGLAAAAAPGQEIIGIPVLKGMDDLQALFHNGTPAPDTLLSPAQRPRCRLLPHWHFGGYARLTQELLDFMNRFYQDTGIPSDFVYTGKLFYAVMDMTRQHFFSPGSRLLVIHSGGLQGNRSLSPGILDF
jgi:1-aminocyclopropane-1-carboxylate deaminase